MGADVRIEIIYFKQDSDIKLEFGLSADYPIRLLTSKCDDEKMFLKRLKTASLRSPIIITVGGFSEEGTYLPEIVAKAINTEMTEMDRGKYKSLDESKIYLPNGSIPIIYSDGSVNGCVIESGPQSIIMLPEDDSNRMKLLKELLVPYITEHYRKYSEISEMHVQEPEEQDISSTEPETLEDFFEPEQELVEQPPQFQTEDIEFFAGETEEFEEISSGEEIKNDEVPLTLDVMEDEIAFEENKQNNRKGSGIFTAAAVSALVILAAALAVLGYAAYKYFF